MPCKPRIQNANHGTHRIGLFYLSLEGKDLWKQTNLLPIQIINWRDSLTEYQKQMWVPFLYDCKPVNDFLPFYPFMIKPQAPIHTERGKPQKKYNTIWLNFFHPPCRYWMCYQCLNSGFYTDSIFRLLPPQVIFPSIYKRSLLSGF